MSESPRSNPTEKLSHNSPDDQVRKSPNCKGPQQVILDDHLGPLYDEVANSLKEEAPNFKTQRAKRQAAGGKLVVTGLLKNVSKESEAAFGGRMSQECVSMLNAIEFDDGTEDTLPERSESMPKFYATTNQYDARGNRKPNKADAETEASKNASKQAENQDEDAAQMRDRAKKTRAERARKRTERKERREARDKSHHELQGMMSQSGKSCFTFGPQSVAMKIMSKTHRSESGGWGKSGGSPGSPKSGQGSPSRFSASPMSGGSPQQSAAEPGNVPGSPKGSPKHGNLLTSPQTKGLSTRPSPRVGESGVNQAGGSPKTARTVSEGSPGAGTSSASDGDGKTVRAKAEKPKEGFVDGRKTHYTNDERMITFEKPKWRREVNLNLFQPRHKNAATNTNLNKSVRHVKKKPEVVKTVADDQARWVTENYLIPLFDRLNLFSITDATHERQGGSPERLMSPKVLIPSLSLDKAATKLVAGISLSPMRRNQNEGGSSSPNNQDSNKNQTATGGNAIAKTQSLKKPQEKTQEQEMDDEKAKTLKAILNISDTDAKAGAKKMPEASRRFLYELKLSDQLLTQLQSYRTASLEMRTKVADSELKKADLTCELDKAEQSLRCMLSEHKTKCFDQENFIDHDLTRVKNECKNLQSQIASVLQSHKLSEKRMAGFRDDIRKWEGKLKDLSTVVAHGSYSASMGELANNVLGHQLKRLYQAMTKLKADTLNTTKDGSMPSYPFTDTSPSPTHTETGKDGKEEKKRESHTEKPKKDKTENSLAVDGRKPSKRSASKNPDGKDEKKNNDDKSGSPASKKKDDKSSDAGQGRFPSKERQRAPSKDMKQEELNKSPSGKNVDADSVGPATVKTTTENRSQFGNTHPIIRKPQLDSVGYQKLVHARWRFATKNGELHDAKETIEQTLASLVVHRNDLETARSASVEHNEYLMEEKTTKQELYEDVHHKYMVDLKEALGDRATLTKEREKLDKKVRDLTDDKEKLHIRLKKYRGRRLKFEQEQKTCKNCGKDYYENDNFNWSCRTHQSEFGGEMWWCCGKLGKDAIGCKYNKHESKEDEEDYDEAEEQEKEEKESKARNLRTRCFSCKEMGHMSKDCPRDPNLRNHMRHQVGMELPRLEQLSVMSKKTVKLIDPKVLCSTIEEHSGFSTWHFDEKGAGKSTFNPFQEIVDGTIRQLGRSIFDPKYGSDLASAKAAFSQEDIARMEEEQREEDERILQLQKEKEILELAGIAGPDVFELAGISGSDGSDEEKETISSNDSSAFGL